MMLKSCEHIVSPNVSASWAKATAGFRFRGFNAVKPTALGICHGKRQSIDEE
jgi:hypothetical protein